MRKGWAQLREGAERRVSEGVQDSKAKTAVKIGCAHSSLVWKKRNGKAQCELCQRSCRKYSFQCPDCEAVACGVCQTKLCSISTDLLT